MDFIIAVVLLARDFASLNIVHVAIRRYEALSVGVLDLGVLETLSAACSIFISLILNLGVVHHLVGCIHIDAHLAHFFLLDVLAFLDKLEGLLAVEFELHVELVAHSTVVVHLKQFFLLVEVPRMQLVVFLCFVSFFFLLNGGSDRIAKYGHLNIRTDGRIPFDRFFLHQGASGHS